MQNTTQAVRVHPIFVSEWNYTLDMIRDMTFEQHNFDHDSTPEEYDQAMQEAAQVAALTDSIPTELLQAAYDWAGSVEDMDWARSDRNWIRSHRLVGIACGAYREFDAEDAKILVYRGSGKATPAKPDFKLDGKAYVLNDGFLDD